MSDKPERVRAEAEASSHRLLLALFGGALLIAVVLGGLERLMPAFHVDRLPTLCAFRRTTGLPCPGCGLTRSWVALGRGAVAESVADHRLGWLVMVWVGLQAVRHALWLVVGSWRLFLERAGLWLNYALIPLAAAMFINWGFVLAGR